MRHKSETQAVGRSRDTYASYNYNERELALKVVLQIMRCYATVSYTDRTSIEGRRNSSLDRNNKDREQNDLTIAFPRISKGGKLVG